MKKKSMLILGVVLSISIIITIIIMFICNKQPKNDVQISQEYKNSKETDSSYFTVSANGTITLAKEYQVGGQFYNELPSEIIIPKKINGTTITAIADGAFENCYNISYIQVPDTVTEIGSAFQNCSVQEITILGKSPSIHLIDVNNLNKVNIPDETIAVTIHSSSLNHLDLPSSVTQLILRCDNLEQLELPTGIDELYLHCAKLKDINIPNTVSQLNLKGCSSIEKITIPDSLTSLESYDYDERTNLPYGAFQDCSNLKEITINSALESIPANTFRNCTNLENIQLPDSITYIGDYAFAYTAISNITIPKAVQQIGNYAFINTNLNEIFLEGNSMLYIGNRIFDDCDKLEIIHCRKYVVEIS